MYVARRVMRFSCRQKPYATRRQGWHRHTLGALRNIFYSDVDWAFSAAQAGCTLFITASCTRAVMLPALPSSLSLPELQRSFRLEVMSNRLLRIRSRKPIKPAGVVTGAHARIRCRVTTSKRAPLPSACPAICFSCERLDLLAKRIFIRSFHLIDHFSSAYHFKGRHRLHLVLL